MERPFRSVAPRRPRWNTRQCRWTIWIVCRHWAWSSRSVDNVQKTLWVCCAAGSSTHIASLFDHLVGEREQRWRQFNAERLGGPEVDEKHEVGRLQHRQVAGLFAVENPAHIGAGLAIAVSDVRPITD